MLTIIGLGPADSGGISRRAYAALKAAQRLILRTARHPAADELKKAGITFETLDSLYESARNFDRLYREIAESVLEIVSGEDAAYAVPGHPLVAEESVRLIIEAARERGIPFEIIGSESFLEPTLEALEVSLSDGLVLRDALAIQGWKPQPDSATLIYQIYDRDTASAVKLHLLEHFPDEHRVTLVRGAGGSESMESLSLHRLDRLEVDHLTCLYVPPVRDSERKKTFDDLVKVMARLRGPGGCPWDREQDHSTLKRYLIEEVYEVIDAIDSGNLDELSDELGDLLLQVVFHAQLEAEAGVFTIDDVIAAIVEKLIRRHPHVFGDLDVADSDEVLRNWEKIKKAEKEPGWRESALDGVPNSLPALMRAMEISKRAVKIGFEWEKFDDVLLKLQEEVGELQEALVSQNEVEIASEIGDLLFTIVNVARWKKIDPEEALRSMLNRFETRFRHIELSAVEQGRRLEEMTLAEMDELWESAKKIQSLK